ncbi:MAG: succinate dehydrogenase iron-sulfur subunit [Pirellulales bacterium]
MNVISVLQRVAAQATAIDGKSVPPVAWDCNCLEEVCGACTMVINGKVRQACSALVDKMLADNPNEIELRPMAKFPVVRRPDGRSCPAVSQPENASKPGFRSTATTTPAPVPGSRKTNSTRAYPLSECMSCGCCLDACPQFGKIEVGAEDRAKTASQIGRTRTKDDYDESFLGAHAISQAMLFNAHPTGKLNAGERLDALMSEGGVQVCGNAQNCVAVCPKEIPLTESIARAGRALTVHAVKKIFDR